MSVGDPLAKPLTVEQVRTAGVFSLDGADFEVENNIWLVGTDEKVIVIDAAHDSRPIVEAIGGRQLIMIVCTHGHNDHINVAVELSEICHGPIAIHPDDTELWAQIYPGRFPDLALTDGQQVDFARHHLHVIHTPGHTPGGVCLYLDDQGVLFSGDTLFQGGPGATGRSFSDFPTIITSIRDRLLNLPSQTIVHPGHGADTTVGAEAPHLEEWIARGY